MRFAALTTSYSGLSWERVYPAILRLLWERVYPAILRLLWERVYPAIFCQELAG